MNNNINFNTKDQTGDNKVNINNFGKQPRLMNSSLESQLESNLSKKNKIIITAVLGDGEAFNFASQIKIFLDGKGYETDGVNQAVYTTPVLGQIIQKRENGGMEIIIGTQQ